MNRQSKTDCLSIIIIFYVIVTTYDLNVFFKKCKYGYTLIEQFA